MDGSYRELVTNALRNRSRLQRALFCLAAVPVLALIGAEGAETGYVPTAAATVLTGTLAVAAVVVPRRHFPTAALAAALASGALTVVTAQLTHRPEVTFGLTELCGLLLVVSRASRQLRPLPAVGVAALASVAAGVLSLRLPHAEYGSSVQLIAPFTLLSAVLAVVLGLYLRLFDRGRERERRAVLQEQRLEYARELHDFVAHHVTAIVAQTKAVRFATTAGHGPAPEELDEMMARIEEAGSAAMESMRSTVSVLRDPSAADAEPPAGDLTQLRPLVASFTKTGPPVELTLDPRLTERGVSPETSTAVHRLVRESLTNVRKHAADAGRVTVSLRRVAREPGELEVTVVDDGQPRASARRPRSRGGYGLLGLTERIEDLGGTLTAGPAAGGGWQVAARLPLGLVECDGKRPATIGA